MFKYVIEREMPGVGNMTEGQLREAWRRSLEVVRSQGSDIQWQQSYLTQDKLYCVYLARDRELIHEHARRGGVPCDRICRVLEMIDPASTVDPWRPRSGLIEPAQEVSALDARLRLQGLRA